MMSGYDLWVVVLRVVMMMMITRRLESGMMIWTTGMNPPSPHTNLMEVVVVSRADRRSLDSDCEATPGQDRAFDLVE
jgi:acid phosphatase family membrane protein YuiD